MATQAQSSTYPRMRPASGIALEVEQLLDRYPALDEDELSTLIARWPHVPPRDAALMLADQGLARKLDAFHRDHGHRMVQPLRGLLPFLLVPIVALVAALWWVLGLLPAA